MKGIGRRLFESNEDLEENRLRAEGFNQVMTITNDALRRQAARDAMEEGLMDKRTPSQVTTREVIESVIGPYLGHLKHYTPEEIAFRAEVGDICGAFRLCAYNGTLDYHEIGTHDPTPTLDFLSKFKPRFPFFSDLFDLVKERQYFCPAYAETLVLLFCDGLIEETNCRAHSDIDTRFIQAGSKLSDRLDEQFDIPRILSECFAKTSGALGLMNLAGVFKGMSILKDADLLAVDLLNRVTSIKFFDEAQWAEKKKELDKDIKEADPVEGKLIRPAMVLAFSNQMAEYVPWGPDELEKIVLTLMAAVNE